MVLRGHAGASFAQIRLGKLCAESGCGCTFLTQEHPHPGRRCA